MSRLAYESRAVQQSFVLRRRKCTLGLSEHARAGGVDNASSAEDP
jgi:hypothetical protein